MRRTNLNGQEILQVKINNISSQVINVDDSTTFNETDFAFPSGEFTLINKMSKYFSLIIILLIVSCSSQKNEIEYIEFEHQCINRKKDDRILITISPSQKKHSRDVVVVELIYHGKHFLRKPINKEEYQKIINAVIQINKENDGYNDTGKDTISLVSMDAALESILYKKGNLQQKYSPKIINRKDNDSFYKACKLITKAAGVDITAIR